MKKRYFVGLILSASLTIMLSSCFAAGPGKTSKNFFELVQEDKIVEAENLFSDRMKANGGQKLKPALHQMSYAFKKTEGKESFTVEKETINGETAEVIISGVDTTGKGGKMKISLIKEKGEWKIDNLAPLRDK